jgi:outer membrane lipoprotein SlyB
MVASILEARRISFLVLLATAAILPGCGPNYSPDTYSSIAVQQANKVDQGIVIGVRPVLISADATLSSGTGAAAGGIAGSTVGTGAVSALTALGGSVAGGVAGNVVGHATGDTNGFEYIVRKPNGDLLSVTQKDDQPLGIGAHVLIIEGPQARIVPDYTTPVVVQPLHTAAEEAKPAAPPVTSPPSPPSPPPPAAPPESEAKPPADATPPAAAPADPTAPATPAATADAAK